MDRNFVLYAIVVCCVLLVVGVLPSVADECSGHSCRNVISMPLMDDMKATLKADLDVTNMNNHLKAYIEQEIRKGVETAMKDVMRQLIDNKLQEANATIEETILEELKRIGVTYVRWGRKGCPDGAEMVYTDNENLRTITVSSDHKPGSDEFYKHWADATAGGRLHHDGITISRNIIGQASGNYYQHNGGGVNNLCLPNDPENGEHQPLANSQIFGAEYMIHASWKQHGMSGNLEFREVPCVVCRRKRRSSVIIVPGRKTCYKDWNAEYKGYLMAAHNDHKKTDYACVDVNAEPFDNKSSYQSDGVLFYPLRTSCGSLRCPPYNSEADVYCVVCSK